MALGWFIESRYPKGIQNETTNSDGVAAFEVPDDVAMRISPIFATDYVGNCSEVQFSLAKVLES
ncbi:MAG TPA: hypothetical protein VEU52_03575, partial [Candidatus Limnocylindrales bacterium]|nr:hypothetical protein [Candidatus Limnocylindrales bacterium]